MSKTSKEIWNEKQAIRIIRTYESLRKAVVQAGGNPDSFTTENLFEMTIFDLLYIISINNIQFRYVGKLPILHKSESFIEEDEDYEN